MPLRKLLKRPREKFQRLFGGRPPAPNDPLPSEVPITWTSLQDLLQVLTRSTDQYTPLKLVMDDLADCIAMYEEAAMAREDYKALNSKLEALFSVMMDHLVGDVPPTMTPSINNLCSAIERELDRMSSKQEGGTSGLLWGAKDSDEVMECYRRIHGNLGRVVLNVDIKRWGIEDEQSTEALLKTLTPSLSANHNSAVVAQNGRREPIPETSEQVLSDLSHWRHDQHQGNIYWLNGMASTGKTAIATNLCAMLEQFYELGASFFCTHQLPECRNVKLILPTVAYQLAAFSRPFHCALSRSLERNPNGVAPSLSNQLESLIIDPLREASEALPTNLVVVVDALDECEDSDEVEQLLGLLVQHAWELPFKVFVSSRSEPQILKKFGSMKVQLVLHQLDDHVAKGDIESYLRTELAGITISNSQLSVLVEHAGVSFILATIMIQYIKAKDSHLGQQERLDNVLSALSTSLPNSHSNFDEMYNLVLASAFSNPGLEESDKDRLRLVLNTVVCVQVSLTVDALAGLLQLGNASWVHDTITPLWSILHVSEGSSLVSALHASLHDYVLDPRRSLEFSCDRESHHGRLAELCLMRIQKNERQFNVCKLESSYVLDKEIPNLDERVRRAIPLDLAYACRYWAVHLELGGLSSKRVKLLDEFLSTGLLLWMEVLNLRKYMTMGPVLLEKARRWCANHDGALDTIELVHDAWRFVATFAASAMSCSTPHVYVSALPYWPRGRPIAERYVRRTKHQVTVVGTAMRRRSPALLAVMVLGAGVASVAFSPDGTRIVSGSDDKTIRVWDGRSGQMVLGPLEGHTGSVRSVAFSPDGTRIVSGSSDKTIRVWDGRSGQMVLALEGHTDSVNSVAFSPDGRRIVSGSSDKTIRVWDGRSGQVVLGPLEGHNDSVTSVAFSPDGRRIVSGSHDKTIRVRDRWSGQTVLGPLKGHTSSVTSVAFSPDGTRIVSGSWDKTIRVWDGRSGQMVLGPLEGHTGSVRSVAFSPDGTRIVSGSSDKTIRVWDGQNGQMVLGPLKGHTSWVDSVAFSPDGTRIISGLIDKTIRVWDGRSGQMVLGPLEGHNDSVTSVAFSPDSTRIVSGSSDKTIRVWDRCEQVAPKPLQVYTSSVSSVSFSPDGTHIASGSNDNSICIWDEHSGQMVLGPLEGHTDLVSAVAFSPDGMHIVSGSSDNTIRVWDGRRGQMMLGPLEGHTGAVLSVAFSPDNMRIASASADRTMCIWDAQSGQMLVGPLKGHRGLVVSVAFSHDGTRIISGSWDKTIRVWNARDGQMVLEPLEGHTHWVNSVALSPDGMHIVSGSWDKTIRVWDLQNGQTVLGPLEGQNSSILSVVFSPDGTCIVSGSRDNTIRVWDRQSGRIILQPLQGHASLILSTTFSSIGMHVVSGSWANTIRVWDGQSRWMVLRPPEIEGHTSSVNSVAFSPDGTRIVSGSDDNTIRVWDGRSGQMVLGPLKGHTDWVNSVALSPDGTRIVSGSHDTTIRVWDGRSGQMVLRPLKGHTGWVWSVAFSPDGTRIVSGSRDTTIRVWDGRSGQMVLGPLKGHTSMVYSVAFSPDGTRIVSGSWDKTIRVWDGRSGQNVLGPLKGHTGWVSSVAFSPDGRRIVSGSYDNTIRVWDGWSGQIVLGPLKGHTRSVNSVAFSPDGTRIVSGSWDKTIRVWDGRSGQMVLGPLEGHTDSVNSVAFSPDGTRIVSGSLDTTIRVWEISNYLSPTSPMPSRHSVTHIHNAMPATCAASPWQLNPDGWVIDEHHRILFWVPYDLHDRLLTPQNPLIISSSSRGLAQLSFDRARIGESWAECYLPA